MSAAEPKVDEALAVAHGLKPDEYARLVALIGRDPTFTELGIVSAMWNEHCSYKSSRLHLRKLPTKGPHVIHGPGENAGVVDIGDGDVCVFKMESHNHPSFIEPYQGAATGVGGILRDVFTMGARPIACLDFLALRRARSCRDPAPRGRRRAPGSAATAIRSACRPSAARPASTGAMTATSSSTLWPSASPGGTRSSPRRRAGVGNPIVYLGSKTGRDGIHGATMASASFAEDAEERRPTVQVGDPFAEKLLLEACLELMASGAVIAIQDMGAAGLTSSAAEMGSKGDLGVELDLDRVPCRETGMSAYEIMLSESQERMLMVLRPEKEREAEAIFRKWELDFAVIGRTTDSRRFVVRRGGEVKADLPIKELGSEAPLYDRPWTETPPLALSRPGRDHGPDADRRGADQAPGLARSRLQTLDHRAVRHAHPRQHHPGPRRRRRGRQARRRAEGPGADHRLHRALLRRRSARRRKTGGGGGVAQPDRRRRAAARAHRQSQFRQSRAARDDGRTGRLHRGHRRGGAGARFSSRFGQRVALQRDDGRRDSADAGDRRGRPRRRRRAARRRSRSRRRATIFC